MPYRYLEDVTQADVAFEATGLGLKEVFRSAWEATLEVMIPGGALPPGAAQKRFHLAAPSWGELLFALLEHVVYVKDAEGLLLAPLGIGFSGRGTALALDARALASPVETLLGSLGTDVKAVTMHRYELKREAGRYTATVVLDV